MLHLEVRDAKIVDKRFFFFWMSGHSITPLRKEFTKANVIKRTLHSQSSMC